MTMKVLDTRTHVSHLSLPIEGLRSSGSSKDRRCTPPASFGRIFWQGRRELGACRMRSLIFSFHMTTTNVAIVLTVSPSPCLVCEALSEKRAPISPRFRRRSPQMRPSCRCERCGNVVGATARLRLGSPRYIQRTFAMSHSAASYGKERVPEEPKRDQKAVRKASICSLEEPPLRRVGG